MKYLSAILLIAVLAVCGGCSNEEENEYYPAPPGSLTLRLSTTNVLLPSTDGSAEISVESNSRWTVRDTGDNSWLTITYTSEPQGTANGTFTITAANNLTGATRTTTVTVTSAERSESITVTQSATSMVADPLQFSVFPAEGGSETLHILSSTKWSATTVADWISLTPSTGEASDDVANVTVTVAPTSLESQRTSEIIIECPDDPTIAAVRIAVSQRGLDPEQTFFEVNPVTLPDFAYGGGSATVNVRSSAPWTARSVASWLSFSPASGLGGDAVAAVSVTADANPDEIAREADIVIESTDREYDPVTIHVRQGAAPAAPVFFEVTPTAIPQFANTGGSVNISVRSSARWHVQSIADWLQFEIDGADASDKVVTFGVTARPNATEVVREAQIVLTPDNPKLKPVTIAVSQAATPPAPKYFEVSPTAFPEFGSDGGNASVSVRSSCTWHVRTVAPWVKFDVQGGAAADKAVTFGVTVAANPDEIARETQIVLEPDDSSLKSVTIAVRQAARPAAPLYFEVNPTTLPAFGAAGGETVLSIRCNAAWTVVTAAPWITLGTTSGTGGEAPVTVSVKVDANNYATAREAEITVTSSDPRTSAPVVVKLQQAAALPPSLGEVTVGGITISEATVLCPVSVTTPVSERGVMYRAGGSGADWIPIADHSADSSRISVTLTGLRPGTQYEVKAYCRATSGSAESPAKTFRTAGTTPGAGDNNPPSRTSRNKL